MNRRGFLKTALAAGAFPLLGGGCFSARGYRANGKVRLAAIGVAQQAWYDLRQFFGKRPEVGGCDFPQDASDICELVALCDTDMGAKETLPAIKAFPDLPRYRDFRVMFDEIGDQIDAVLVAIPDFSHFPACMHAMKLGKAVYVEKPLAHSFRECALLAAAEKKYGVVTQMGNQGHTSDKYYQHKQYFESGFIKDVQRVNVHMNMSRRWAKYKGNIFNYPLGEEIPATLDYDTWLASARYHEYSPAYMRGEWRCWFDFGNGSIGDWGAHTMDCIHEFVLHGELPTEVKLERVEGWNQFAFPTACTLAFTFPKSRYHDDIEVRWYDGAENLPPLPKGFVYATPDGIPKNSANAESEFARKQLFPGKEVYCKDGSVWQSLSHKHPIHRVGDYEAKLPDFPHATDSHYRSFIRAVKGEVKTTSPFSIAAPLSQIFCLGCIAQRVRRGFKFDRATGTIPGDEYANYFINGHAPRKGWEGYYEEI